MHVQIFRPTLYYLYILAVNWSKFLFVDHLAAHYLKAHWIEQFKRYFASLRAGFEPAREDPIRFQV